jgi:hypothetical protein
MERVEIGAVAGGTFPLHRTLDGGPVAPLIEGGDQLERLVGRDHIADIL